jgi:hypothetical protein
MTAVQGPAVHVVGLLPPDRQHVVGGADPGCAPQDEHRAADPAFRVGGVVDQVDGGAGAVVLAGRVDRGRIEAAPVLRDRGVGQGAGCPAPFAEGVVKVEDRVGADQPFRQIRELDQEEVPPHRGGVLLVERGMSRAITRLEYGSWLPSDGGLPLSPEPRRSGQTTVNRPASRGATRCHIACVCGYPCSSSSGGPSPPCTR